MFVNIEKITTTNIFNLKYQGQLYVFVYGKLNYMHLKSLIDAHFKKQSLVFDYFMTIQE